VVFAYLQFLRGSASNRISIQRTIPLSETSYRASPRPSTGHSFHHTTAGCCLERQIQANPRSRTEDTTYPCHSETHSYPVVTMVSSTRPRTPSSKSSPPAENKLAAIPEASKTHPPRRSSLGLLLRRSKSGELKPSKKQQALAREQEAERLRREAAAVSKSPPRLPDLYNGQKPATLPFGGEDRPDSVAIMSGRAGGYAGRSSMEPGRSSAATGSVPIPPIPSNGARGGDYVDPYARTESMTHRGRYSYASSAVSTINSPRRVRRRKDPTPFK